MQGVDLVMKELIQTLYSAQTTLMRFPNSAPEYLQALTRLQQNVPGPVLAHYLRLVERGSKGVAPVRKGVCSSCHMRIPSGHEGALRRTDDLVLCETCGAYLFIPPEELRPAVTPAKPKAVRRKKGMAQPVASTTSVGAASVVNLSAPSAAVVPGVGAVA